MTSANVDLEAVINDLADRIKKLTLENAMLRSALASSVTPAAETQEDADS
jgi:regulator of replication initiation timing